MVKQAERNLLQPGSTENQPYTFQQPREELRHILYVMDLIRRFDDRGWEMYTRGRIGGYFHTNHGEEAVIAGAILPLRSQDWIVSFYREHGHIIARGSDPKNVMAELFGRRDGVARGRGGSMHLFDAGRRFLGGYGIVAGQMPLAAGVGYSIKYRSKSDEVALMLTGDGAMANGASHEALNMIGLYRLPVITVIVNNQYGMGTTVDRSAANPDLWKRGEMYNMDGIRVDGMDVMQVTSVMQDAIQRALNGEPSLIEAICYRYRGHSVADPARYRATEEVQAWRDQDPIQRFYRQLLAADLISEDEWDEIQERVNAQVDAAVEFAENDPEPDPSGLMDFLYVDPPPNV